MLDGSSIPTLIAQVGLSGIFLYLYLSERKDHREDNRTKDATISTLQEARRQDAVETRDKVTNTLSGISQTLDSINTKIVVSKSNQEG